MKIDTKKLKILAAVAFILFGTAGLIVAAYDLLVYAAG